MNRTFWNVPLSFAACFALAATTIAAPPATTHRAAARPGPSGEDDGVRAWRGAGSQDRLAQRAGAAVGKIEDRESARKGSVFQRLNR